MNHDGLIKAARVLAKIADHYTTEDIPRHTRVKVLSITWGDCLDAREALRSETADARRAFEAALRKGE